MRRGRGRSSLTAPSWRFRAMTLLGCYHVSPAEHVHRPADRADAGRGVRARAGAGGFVSEGVGSSYRGAAQTPHALTRPLARRPACGVGGARLSRSTSDTLRLGRLTSTWAPTAPGAGDRRESSQALSMGCRLLELVAPPHAGASATRTASIGDRPLRDRHARLRPHRRGARRAGPDAPPRPRRRRLPPGLPPARARDPRARRGAADAARARRASGGSRSSSSDLDALAAQLGPERLRPIKQAVQPGRRIATLDRAAGLKTNVAFMTPEP